MLVKEVTSKEWQQWYEEINGFLSERRIIDALDKMSLMAKKTGVSLYIDKIEEYLETYKNILHYSFSDVDDPQREGIYMHLIVSLLELSDTLKNLHVHFAPKGTEEERKGRQHMLRAFYNNENIDLPFDTLSDQVFNDLVSLPKLQEEDKQFLHYLLLADVLPWYDKCTFLSALMLSLQQCFDKQKIHLLFAVYDAQEDIVWQRALIALLIAYYQYDDRMGYYPELLRVWGDYAGKPDFEKQVELIVIQFLRARDTEKINKRLKDDLLPEVQKVSPKIMDKLGLDELLSDADEEGMNPEWKTVFEDTPGLYDKLEEISKMQMEGSDIFMGAFSQLKSFPFFSPISHWFIPFYADNPYALEILKKEDIDVHEFVASLAKSPFICNSDKYSFCLNMTMIPPAQKKIMNAMMFEELKMMGELGDEDALVNKTAHDKTLFTQYIQDLYRFYKLNRDKTLFYNVFDQEYDFYNTNFFKENITSREVLRNIGEFCLEKQHYQESVTIFQILLEEPDYDSSELLEKVAYSYQKSAHYSKALRYYQQAELLDSNLPWLYKNLIYCFRKTGNPKQIIVYCNKAIDLDGEDTYLLTYLGHAYFDLKDYEEALKYYFKVEYLSSNTKVYRPIAWCAFVLGKFEIAEKYFQLILNNKKTGYFDFMNYGHTAWCMKKYEQAKTLYLQTMKEGGIGIQQFQQEMLTDKKHLLRFGIQEYDVHLMLDYLKINAPI